MPKPAKGIHHAPAPWRRSSRLEIHMRPGERADLDSIADEWGVAASAVGWVIIASYIAKHRGRKLADLPFSTGGTNMSTTHKAIMAIEEAYEEQESGDSQETGADAPADGSDCGDRDQLPDPD